MSRIPKPIERYIDRYILREGIGGGDGAFEHIDVNNDDDLPQPGEIDRPAIAYIGELDSYAILEEDAWVNILDQSTIGPFPIPEGVIAMTTEDDISEGWIECDGNNGTIDMRDHYVRFTNDSSEVGDTFGSDSAETEGHSHEFVDFTTFDIESGDDRAMVVQDNTSTDTVEVDLIPNSYSVMFVKAVDEGASLEKIQSFTTISGDDIGDDRKLLDEYEGRMPRGHDYDTGSLGDTFGSDIQETVHGHDIERPRDQGFFDADEERTNAGNNIDDATVEKDVVPEIVLLNAVEYLEKNAILRGGDIFLWDGALSNIPPNFALADGSNDTDNVIGYTAKLASSESEILDKDDSGVDSTIDSHTHEPDNSFARVLGNDNEVIEREYTVSDETGEFAGDIDPKQLKIVPIQVV